MPTRGDVNAKVAQTVNQLKEFNPNLFGGIVMPYVKFTLKGATAGRAGRNQININTDYLNDPRYTDSMMNETIPHEVAHSVVRQVWGTSPKPHGPEWKFVMKALGLEASRCHTYEPKYVRKLDRSYIYVCSCTEHKLTQILHRRIQKGQNRYCRRCKQTITFSRTER